MSDVINESQAVLAASVERLQDYVVVKVSTRGMYHAVVKEFKEDLAPAGANACLADFQHKTAQAKKWALRAGSPGVVVKAEHLAKDANKKAMKLLSLLSSGNPWFGRVAEPDEAE